MTDLEPVRHSRLKLFDLSAMHFEHGNDYDSSPMRKGSGLHSLLLGDSTRVRVYDGRRDPRSKAYQEYLANNPDCEILIASEMKDVNGMRRSIERCPAAMKLLDGAVREERIEWEYQGRACAGTPDVVHIDKRTGAKMLVELKTTRCAKPEKFRWQAHGLGYHSQLAYYAHGLEQTMLYKPGPVTAFKIVAVESKPPYPVVIINVTPQKIRKGRQLWQQWFAALLACEQAQRFPGYADGEVDWDDDQDGDGLDWGDEEAA
jgi:hypothetical protein